MGIPGNPSYVINGVFELLLLFEQVVALVFFRLEVVLCLAQILVQPFLLLTQLRKLLVLTRHLIVQRLQVTSHHVSKQVLVHVRACGGDSLESGCLAISSPLPTSGC